MSKNAWEQDLNNVWDLLLGFAEAFVPNATEGLYAWSRRMQGADDINIVSDVVRKASQILRQAYDNNPTTPALQEAEKLAKKLMQLESYADVHTGASKKAFEQLHALAERRANEAQRNYERAVNDQNKAVADAQNRISSALTAAAVPNTRNLRTVDDALGTDYSRYAGPKNAFFGHAPARSKRVMDKVKGLSSKMNESDEIK